MYTMLYSIIKKKKILLFILSNFFSYWVILKLLNFKGLDLIDRVSEELWMEVPDIVQEAVINTIPKKKKCKKAKWLSEKALQIVEKRSEPKGKGEKERDSSECSIPENNKES